jgi:hypothetical protein
MGRYLYPTLRVYEVWALTTSHKDANYAITAAVDPGHGAQAYNMTRLGLQRPVPHRQAGTGGWLVKVGSCHIDRARSAHKYTTQRTVP